MFLFMVLVVSNQNWTILSTYTKNDVILGLFNILDDIDFTNIFPSYELLFSLSCNNSYFLESTFAMIHKLYLYIMTKFINRFVSKPIISKFNDGWQNKYFAEDPTFMGFSIHFDMSSPLLNPKENGAYESAERYFNRLGNKKLESYTRELRIRLKDLENNYQYFFQSISGLNELYKRGESPYDLEISIETLESLDMRLAKVKELYNNITYDFFNKKDILPRNLRWLTVNIIVNDGRRIGKWLNNKVVDATPSLDTMIFTLENSEFDFSTGHDFLETISNAEPEVSSNSIILKGGRSHMKKFRMGLDEILTNAISYGNIASLKDTLVSTTKNETTLNKIKNDSKELANLNKSREVERKLNFSEMLNTGVKKVVDDFGNAGKRELRKKLVDELVNIKEKSRIGNVFFRGAGAEFVNNKDFFKLVKDSAKNGLLPNLSANILDIIINNDNMTFEQQKDVYSELVRITNQNSLDEL